ncbi:hypothetical protein RRF57_010647 [Xylaria bambusicola]|uniref:Uncharacterized protein n=1 Tax=Xylaria bambusicola TaxID=326684 RepID=A0AAN7ULK3_9PEZI
MNPPIIPGDQIFDSCTYTASGDEERAFLYVQREQSARRERRRDVQWPSRSRQECPANKRYNARDGIQHAVFFLFLRPTLRLIQGRLDSAILEVQRLPARTSHTKTWQSL